MRQGFGTKLGTAGAALLLSLVVAASAAGCAGKKESIVSVGDGKQLSADQIDADPLALLPGGALVVAQLDVAALLTSALGPQTLRMATAVVPLTPQMNFQPQRDLKSIAGGLYSMQGADAAAVATGNFDPDAIKKAADSGAITALGKPLQKVSYANNDLYLTGDVGFVLLTQHTLLVGNPAGMRRSLDRLRDGRVKREIPDWIAQLLKTPNAQLVVAGDLSGQSVPAAVVAQMPFLGGLRTVRVIGNFQSPGVNLAGSLTYPDPDSAMRGDGQLKGAGQMASFLNMFAPFGISSPLRTLTTNPQGNEVQFVAAIDGPALAALLDKVPLLTGMMGMGSGSAAPLH